LWLAHINKNTKNENIKQHINEFICTDYDNSMKIMDYNEVSYCPNLQKPSTKKRPTIINNKDIQITGTMFDQNKLNKLAMLFNVHTINISNSTFINPLQ